MNIQFRNPDVFRDSISENYLKIDFSGWKYFMFLFREPDVESMPDYHWPYPHTLGNDEHVRTTMLDTEHIEYINLYLNCIPSHGSTDIEISDPTAFSQKKMELTEICINCNQKEIKLPFNGK